MSFRICANLETYLNSLCSSLSHRYWLHVFSGVGDFGTIFRGRGDFKTIKDFNLIKSRLIINLILISGEKKRFKHSTWYYNTVICSCKLFTRIIKGTKFRKTNNTVNTHRSGGAVIPNRTPEIRPCLESTRVVTWTCPTVIEVSVVRTRRCDSNPRRRHTTSFSNFDFENRSWTVLEKYLSTHTHTVLSNKWVKDDNHCSFDDKDRSV